MARRSSQQADHAAAIHYSSLALLQERFNQLQKTREMRQERELLRFISHAATNSNTTSMHYHHQQPSSSPSSVASCYYYDSDELLTFQQQRQPSSQMGFPSIRPPPQLIVRRPNSGDTEEAAAASQETKSLLFGTKNFLGLHNTAGTGSSSPLMFELDSCTPPDVDTSLHL